MQELLLLENPGSDIRSEVMSRAGELRSEGYDASEALSQAWSEAKGEDNPDDDYLEVLPEKRRSKVEFQPSAFSWLLLLAGAGYLGWCAYIKSKTGSWNWQPWKPTATSRISSNHS
jgi:hypothetical protein